MLYYLSLHYNKIIEVEERRKKKQKRKEIIEINKITEEWEIWDKKEIAKSKEKTKKLVFERFYK